MKTLNKRRRANDTISWDDGIYTALASLGFNSPETIQGGEGAVNSTSAVHSYSRASLSEQKKINELQ